MFHACHDISLFRHSYQTGQRTVNILFSPGGSLDVHNQRMQYSLLLADSIRRIPGNSGHTIIQVDRQAQNCILLYGGSNRAFTREYIDEVLEGFEAGDVLLLQNEINLVDYAVEKGWERGMKVVLNPSPMDDKLDAVDMKKVSLFLLNEVEGAQIAGTEDPDRILEQMAEKFPNAEVVLTLGSRGSVYQAAAGRCARRLTGFRLWIPLRRETPLPDILSRGCCRGWRYSGFWTWLPGLPP